MENKNYGEEYNSYRWEIMWDVLFNSSPESIIILSEDQTIMDVNDTTLKLLGIKREDVLGKKCYEIFHKTQAPPEGCPFVEMKKRDWKPCMNEMETIVGEFLVEVVPVDIPGEPRKILHFARDMTLINELAIKLINSLQRYTSFLDTLIKLDGLMLREKDLQNLLTQTAKIICDNENFEASWILLKDDDALQTVSRYGVNWNFEDKHPSLLGDIKEGIWNKKDGDKQYIFISLIVEERFLGILVLLKNNDIELSEDDKKILRIMADNLAIAIRERKLEIGRSVAYKELEKNIKSFALLIDGIRNPLAVMMGIAETMIKDEKTKEEIIKEIEKIEEITYKIDKRWSRSDYLRNFLKEM